MEKRKKILVVEDESVIKVIGLKLSNAGFSVDTARNGMDAMDKILADKPDLILLDLVTPALDGFGVLERIRGDRNLREIPVLVFSNLGDQADIDRANAFGIVGYVVKAHVQLEDLVQRVKDFFSRQ